MAAQRKQSRWLTLSNASA
jgi:hypothetical protein